MLCNKQQLAKTSGNPGKTQLINHFEVNKSWYLVDLPGFGFAKVSQSQRKKWEKMIQDYLQKRETLVNVFLLIDSRHSPQKLDLDFANRLGEWQIPFALVFTKSDKSVQKEVAANVKAFQQAMLKTWESLPPHFVTSATKRLGRSNILDFIQELNEGFVMPENK